MGSTRHGDEVIKLLSPGVESICIDSASMAKTPSPRKGYWRMSSNRIVQQALNNRWLEQREFPTCDIPALQAVGPHDILVHGRQHRFHIAGVETVVKVHEKFCFVGHRVLLVCVARARVC